MISCPIDIHSDCATGPRRLGHPFERRHNNDRHRFGPFCDQHWLDNRVQPDHLPWLVRTAILLSGFDLLHRPEANPQGATVEIIF